MKSFQKGNQGGMEKTNPSSDLLYSIALKASISDQSEDKKPRDYARKINPKRGANRKYDNDDILVIRSLKEFHGWSCGAIISEFGINKYTLSNILGYRNYAYLTPTEKEGEDYINKTP